MISKEYQSIASISFNDSRQYISGRCIIGFFSLRMKILDCKSRMSINMCQHPAYQVNVPRKEVLCAPDFSKFSGTPCRSPYFHNAVKIISETLCINWERQCAKRKLLYPLRRSVCGTATCNVIEMTICLHTVNGVIMTKIEHVCE